VKLFTIKTGHGKAPQTGSFKAPQQKSEGFDSKAIDSNERREKDVAEEPCL
jgi:hypothetical protein